MSLDHLFGVVAALFCSPLLGLLVGMLEWSVFWHLCIGLCSSYDLCLLGLQKLMLWVDYQGCLCCCLLLCWAFVCLGEVLSPMSKLLVY